MRAFRTAFASIPLLCAFVACGGHDAASGLAKCPEKLTPTCPAGTAWDGTQCVGKKVVTQVDCPAGSSWDGSRCVGAVAPAPAPAASADAMVRIPAGTFLMGSDDRNFNEKPMHKVQVASFEMDVTEVTVAAYAACVSRGGCAPAPTTAAPAATTAEWGISDAERAKWSAFCNADKTDKASHPINCVDWNQASAYCKWASKRLPSEEEWEYAARGSDGQKYPWGNDAPSGQLCWLRMPGGAAGDASAWGGTCAVGSYPAGRSPFGLLDMAGNVWEWTASGWSDDYTKKRTDRARVFRGGAWNVGGASGGVHGAMRLHGPPSHRDTTLGFRCAR